MDDVRELSLQEYVSILRRRWKLIAVVPLLLGLLGFFWSNSKTRPSTQWAPRYWSSPSQPQTWSTRRVFKWLPTRSASSRTKSASPTAPACTTRSSRTSGTNPTW